MMCDAVGGNQATNSSSSSTSSNRSS